MLPLSAFDSILKMSMLCNRTENPYNRRFVFESIVDLNKCGLLQVGEFPCSALMSKNSGYADMLAFKLDLLNTGLTQVAQDLRLQVASVGVLNRMMATHSSYRRSHGALKPDGTQEPVDRTWMMDMSSGHLLFAQLLEQIAYSTQYDRTIHQVLKFRKSPLESFKYGSIGAQLQVITLG